MTKNTVRLIFDSVDTYLSGGASTQTEYTGSGTPWTAESTTPYELSLNDATPIWVPTAPVSQAIYGGGPPFRIGQTLAYKNWGNVTETVGIQMRATTHDNAVFLLRRLRQILNTSLFSVPCMLAVQSGTNTAYYEIYHADIQETPAYITETTSTKAIIRAAVTWTRSAFGGTTSLTTLINGVSFANRGTSSPDNIDSYGTLTGDLVNEGQPLNISIPGSSTFNPRIVHLSSIYSRTYSSESAAVTTSSTTGTRFGSGGSTTANIADALVRLGLRCRMLARFTTFTNPDKILLRARASIFSALNSETILYESRNITLGAGSSARFLDFGGFDLQSLRTTGSASGQTVNFVFYLVSSDGTSVTATLDYFEVLLYYDFCTVNLTGAIHTTGSENLYVIGAQSLNGTAWAPRVPPLAYYGDPADDSTLTLAHPIRGTAPRAFTGASLYLAWTGSAYEHTTTDTATVTVTHLPLYYTIRGGA